MENRGYYVVLVNAGIKEVIDEKKRPNRYGVPYIWDNLKECKEWVMKRLYKGMSHKYMIVESAPHGCLRKVWLIHRDNEGNTNIKVWREYNV